MEIRLATNEDIVYIRELITKRVNWMNEVGIKHWNQFDYLELYPVEYFEERVKEGILYVATLDGKVVGSYALWREDYLWDNDVPAIYVHNFVGDVDVRGVGRFLLEQAEIIAKEAGINVLRLDCQKDDVKLNEYYESMGYKIVGTCTEGDEYFGYKREKRIGE